FVGGGFVRFLTSLLSRRCCCFFRSGLFLCLSLFRPFRYFSSRCLLSRFVGTSLHGSCSARLLTSASSCSFLLCRSTFDVHVIVVHQFDKSHLGVIAKAVLKLDNPRVATWTVSHFLRNLTEKDRYRFFVFQVAKYHPTRVR